MVPWERNAQTHEFSTDRKLVRFRLNVAIINILKNPFLRRFSPRSRFVLTKSTCRLYRRAGTYYEHERGFASFKISPVMYNPSQIVCVGFSCDLLWLFVSSELGKADSHCNLQLFVTIGTIEKITRTKARTDRLVLSMQRSFSFQ